MPSKSAVTRQTRDKIAAILGLTSLELVPFLHDGEMPFEPMVDRMTTAVHDLDDAAFDQLCKLVPSSCNLYHITDACADSRQLAAEEAAAAAANTTAAKPAEKSGRTSAQRLKAYDDCLHQLNLGLSQLGSLIVRHKYEGAALKVLVLRAYIEDTIWPTNADDDPDAPDYPSCVVA
jgi:hypothetical protein